MSMTLISSVTVGAGGAGSIDFTSIPQQYTDLILMGSIRSTYPGVAVLIALYPNGQPYPLTSSSRELRGNGSSVTSSTFGTNEWINAGRAPGPSTTTNNFGNFQIYIPNYANTTTNKSFSVDSIFENNATEAWQVLSAATWPNTAAITAIKIESVTIAEYSNISLYGVLKGSGGATVS